jgi:rhodanese-related sulfurtransferase
VPYELSAQELANRISAGKPLLIVDVREDWEREIGALPHDVHIPMRTVPQHLADFKVPEGGEIIVYCHAGVRSMMVAGFLEENGVPSVGSLAGGIDAWSVTIDPTVPRY